MQIISGPKEKDAVRQSLGGGEAWYKQSPYQGGLSRVKRHTEEIKGGLNQCPQRGGSWRLVGGFR